MDDSNTEGFLQNLVLEGIAVEDFKDQLKLAFYKSTEAYEEFNELFNTLSDEEVEHLSRHILFKTGYYKKDSHQLLKEGRH